MQFVRGKNKPFLATFYHIIILKMRKETNYNVFVWKTKDGNYVFLEDAFSYDDSNTRGLTGYELEFHTEEEAEESLNNMFDSEGYDYYLEYLKRERPRNVSYDDRCEMVQDERGNDYDDSFSSEKCVQDALEYANEKEGENYEYTNCVGAWRHFDDKNTKKSYYEYVIPQNFQLLQKLYKEYEK